MSTRTFFERVRHTMGMVMTMPLHEAAYGQAWDDNTMRKINDYFNNAAPNILEQARNSCADVKLNNDDIHSIPMILSADSDDESVAADSDNEEEFTIHPEDIVRHVWRGVNISYVVMHHGVRLFITADQLDLASSVSSPPLKHILLQLEPNQRSDPADRETRDSGTPEDLEKDYDGLDEALAAYWSGPLRIRNRKLLRNHLVRTGIHEKYNKYLWRELGRFEHARILALQRKGRLSDWHFNFHG
ncbi:hypothetical protein NCC49_002648 [Naganishia albida]|nr:hypothetical protein NCC49_002648 [Naganishia albida]